MATIVKRSGFYRDATDNDRTNLTPLEGKLSKLSTRKSWQTRYFALNNGFLNYYKDSSKGAVLAAIDLSKVTAVEATDLQSGRFQLTFDDDATYDLRAPTSKQCAQWVESLEARAEWAKRHAPGSSNGSGGAAKGSRPGAGSAGGKKAAGKRGDADAAADEEEGEEDGLGNGGRSRPRPEAQKLGANRGRPPADSGPRPPLGSTTGGRPPVASKRPPAPSSRRPGPGAAVGARAGGRDEEEADSEDGSGDSEEGEGGDRRSVANTGSYNSMRVTVGRSEGAPADRATPKAALPWGQQQQPARPVPVEEGSEEGSEEEDDEAGGGGGRRHSTSGAAARASGGLAGPGRPGVAGGSDAARRSAGGGGGGGILAGHQSRRAREAEADARPRPPPAPRCEGWVKKKAMTRFGKWQARFARLSDGVIRFADDASPGAEFSNSISVDSVKEVRLLVGSASASSSFAARAASAVDRKTFVLVTSFNPKEPVSLRAENEKAAADWVAAITAAVKWQATHGRASGGGGKPGSGGKGHSHRRARPRSDDEEEEDGRGRSEGDEDDNDEDREEDSDRSDGEEGAGGVSLPPAPKWFQPYAKPDEARWMNATQAFLDRLFAPIYARGSEAGEEGGDAPEEDEGAVGGGGGAGDRPVFISKLAEATARACAELEDRVMECRMRARADVIKHFIQMFDLKFLQELTPLTTGMGPSALSPTQLLQVIDCIEGFVVTRRRALGSMQLSASEKRPGNVLRETRRDMIGRYMEVMGPKLHTVAQKVLGVLFAQRGNLVRRTIGTRVGTTSPTDLFNYMSEHLNIARDGGSYTLQRRLLSAVMAEVVFYAQGVLADLMDWWLRDAGGVDMDYVTAVINDSGVMLDHLEQLESYFADALAKEAGSAELRSVSLGRSGGLALLEEDEKDEFDKEEEAQAKEDLAAIEQDIPRAKSELLNSGCQLTGVLVDIICADFKEPLAKLFTSDWEKVANLVTVISATVTDYFTESRLLLDGFFFDRLVGMVLTHLVEQYAMRLLGTLKPDKKEKYTGGFTSRFRLTDERLKRVVADIIELCNGFSHFMAREDLTLITQCINQIREMLTIDLDNLPTVFELALKSNPTVSTHVYLAFERCVALREDLNKASRKSMLESALKQLLEYGQPPEDTDDLMATAGILGSGIMHGASMSQGSAWSPAHVTQSIYGALFPNALERSKALFLNWNPPARQASPAAPAGHTQSSIAAFMSGASASASEPALGGSGGSGIGKLTSFSGGANKRGGASGMLDDRPASSGSSNARGSLAPFESDHPAPTNGASSFASFGASTQKRAASRRMRGGEDDDDADDNLGGGGAGGRRSGQRR